jgi:hypothetical protein
VTLGERIPRWSLVIAALATAAVWFGRRLIREEREADARLDAWAAEHIADLLAARGDYDRGRLRSTLDGGPPEPEVSAWIDAQGLRVSLEYERDLRGAREHLVIETRSHRRRVERARAWDELPANVRAAFLRGDTRVSLSWQAPWHTVEARRS